MTFRTGVIFGAVSLALFAHGAWQIGRGLWEMTHESWVRL